MELAIGFIACGVISLVLLAVHARNRLLVGTFVIAALVVAYVLAGASKLSPFSISGAVGFGYWDNSAELAVGLAGILLGIVIEFRASRPRLAFRLEDILQPLFIAPLILIPSLKIIEDLSDPDLIAHAVLFCTSFQNGYFWKKATEKKP